MSSSLPPAKVRTTHTLSRGMMAMNEPIGGLEGIHRVSFIATNALTDKNQGLTELGIMKNPLQALSVIRFRAPSSKRHARKAV